VGRAVIVAPSDAMRARLLSWYDANKRDLPWRGTRDPYAVWVSEVMLQQTRVDTVKPYFERFMVRFPTPQALADAPEDDVLAAWSGLGYYRRARLLHAGVREVVERHGGRVPEAREARLSLPGVGRYTAGAIGSIAFQRPEPIVDGNVARVLARFGGIDTPLGRADTGRRLWRMAERWVRGERPGDLNQALMELGATVCTPGAPDCQGCPLARRCVARRQGRQAELPVPKVKRSPRAVSLLAVVATTGARHRGDLRVWLARAEGALFGGLWGPPMVEPTGALGRAGKDLLRGAGLSARLAEDPVARVDHVLTHRRLAVDVLRATATRALRPSPTVQAVALQDLSRVGTSTLTRKVLRQALGDD
jgi:A/G-specific adenine glycosylase